MEPRWRPESKLVSMVLFFRQKSAAGVTFRLLTGQNTLKEFCKFKDVNIYLSFFLFKDEEMHQICCMIAYYKTRKF